ncbi:hypothetical protein KQI49_05060 [Virgibacillus sp. MSJ-26]|uniref:hypothetical protein n=1 Tax=Virgibacillus sp. MSJ-26 TaxID=2841522 RepID=UPI001C105FCE|nr:hypothetical protein [Virgibacillus sp. MSJ-26]MBU5466201.1 hypothetical protein [Virgibacillus sp. MSJ-26]
MKFYCTGEDYYFTKLFSRVQLKSGINKRINSIRWNGIKKILFIAVSIIILAFISMYFENHISKEYKTYSNLSFSILIITLVISGIISVLRLVKEINYVRNSENNEPFNLKEKIMIYEITDNGIYFNEYNRNNRNEMTLIPWDKVKKVVIGELIYPQITIEKHRNVKKNMLEEGINKIQKVHSDFHCPVLLKHEDKLGMSLYFNSLYSEYLAIPSGWGSAENFIDEITKHVEVSYEKETRKIELLD